MFCRNCGTSIQPNASFCPGCGTQVQPDNFQQSPQGEKSSKSRKPTKEKRSLKKLLLYLGGGFLLLIFLLALIGSCSGDGSALELGDTAAAGEMTIGKAGGSLAVDKEDSSVSGLTLTVPAGAYEQDLNFAISETEIKDHSFGDLFEPITPLISIDNGHGFAQKPMTLTIPINLAPDEFALAFYYDPETGRLEGIPTVDLNSSSMTIMTAHFSDIVVSKVKKSVLDGRIMDNEAGTAFLPGKDDFPFVNLGSAAAPGGHCAGQSVAMMHYFTAHTVESDTGKNLRSEEILDNNAAADTKGLWQDDSLAYRLCSVLQKNFGASWNSMGSALNDNFIGRDDLTYYSFAYAMSLTKSPQLVYVSGTSNKGKPVAHAMLIYSVSPEGLAVADPNTPGNLLRFIPATYLTAAASNGSLIELGDYVTGERGDAIQYTFTDFVYLGAYSLVSYGSVDALWDAVLQGNDVGQGIFPADSNFVALAYDPSTATETVIPLRAQHSISSAETAAIDTNSKDTIFISVPTGVSFVTHYFYRGDQQVLAAPNMGINNNLYATIKLNRGVNDIGIQTNYILADGERYSNFARFQITLTEDPLPVATDATAQTQESESTPEPAPEPTPAKETTPAPAPTPTPTPAPSPAPAPAPKEYDYNAAMKAWAADFAAREGAKTFDDGQCRTTTTFEWVKAPFIKGGGVYGAHKLYYNDVYYAGPKAGTSQYYMASEIYDAANPGEYISLAELKKAYPQF